MPAIFISHSSADNAHAAEIKAWLASIGLEQVFLDFDKTTGIGAGKDWERELYEAIERCQAVIALITPAWLASKWCFAEVANARAQGKPVFPIVFTPDAMKMIGPELQSIQAELWNDDGQKHLGERLHAIADEIARGYRFDGKRPPWPGILSYEAEDAAIFFGRDPEIRRLVEEKESAPGAWPRDPDGAPLYPGGRHETGDASEPHVLRLDMEQAIARTGLPQSWQESGAGPSGETGSIMADPAAWGDVVLARRDTPTSYNLSVVIDDALQGVSHVVRGRDLFHATSVHVVLQELLGLARPLYHHHDLVLGEDGRKLSKSNRDTSLKALREAGVTPGDIRKMIGL